MKQALFEKENSQQLSEKIKLLIDNPQKAKLMGEKAELFSKKLHFRGFEKRLKNIAGCLMNTKYTKA